MTLDDQIDLLIINIYNYLTYQKLFTYLIVVIIYKLIIIVYSL